MLVSPPISLAAKAYSIVCLIRYLYLNAGKQGILCTRWTHRHPNCTSAMLPNFDRMMEPHSNTSLADKSSRRAPCWSGGSSSPIEVLRRAIKNTLEVTRGRKVCMAYRDYPWGVELPHWEGGSPGR